MSSIQKYVDEAAVKSLCSQIDMPNEVTEQILVNIRECDFEPIAAPFYDLFDMAKGKDANQKIEDYFGQEQHGLKVLTVCIMAALHTKELYDGKGIEEKIYIDTMKMFTRFVNEHKFSYHIYGFDRGFWTYRILAIGLVRLGELEYEMYALPEEIMGHGAKGDPVISIHIPSDAVLTRERLDESYQLAADFFEQYFDTFRYKFMFTDTWLLSQELKNLLPETSKILMFQSDYQVVMSEKENEEFIEWIFKKRYDDFNELTENTSLERNVKRHLLAGGKIGNAFGILQRV